MDIYTPLHIQSDRQNGNTPHDRPRHHHVLHVQNPYLAPADSLQLTLMGAKINLEILSDKGRIDAILELDKLIYIIEFKMGKAEEAKKQIEDKQYWEPYTGLGKELVEWVKW